MYITDDTYTKHQVIEMEKHILKVHVQLPTVDKKQFVANSNHYFTSQKLKFELGSPLPIHFLRRYSKAAMSDATTHVMSKYFIELAAIDYQLCEYLPSQVRSVHRCQNGARLTLIFIHFPSTDCRCIVVYCLVHQQQAIQTVRLRGIVDTSARILHHMLAQGFDADHPEIGWLHFECAHRQIEQRVQKVSVK